MTNIYLQLLPENSFSFLSCEFVKVPLKQLKGEFVLIDT